MNVMTIDDLAALLKVKRATVISRLSRDPKSLPPKLDIPGNKQPLWLPQDVQRWLESRRARA